MRPEPTRAQPSVLLTGVASDSHTWNLVFLELLITEHGCQVTNLGPAVPPRLLTAIARRLRPDLVVISSVNGHGAADGLAAITRLRAEPRLAGVPVVIGGKLGVTGAPAATEISGLRRAGFTAVYGDGDDLPDFLAMLASLRTRAAA